MSFEIFYARPNIWINADGVVHNLSLVTSIKFTYIDVASIAHEITIPAADFIIQTTTEILFLVPDACDFALVATTVTIDGTIFTGSVPLGPDEVIITDGSGIYSLVLNQTHDTLYIDSATTNVTADVKIPDPSFKTGFING